MTNGRLPEKCQRLSNLYTNKTQYKIQNNYEQNRKKIQKYEKSQNGWTKLWHNQLMCVHAVHHITSDIMPDTEK